MAIVSPDLLLVALYNEPVKKLIARLGKGKVQDPPFEAVEPHCSDMQLLQGFSLDDFPFVITRSEDSINLLNVNDRKSYMLIKAKKPKFDNQYLRIVYLPRNKNAISLIYSSVSTEEGFDEIKKFKLSSKFVNGLKHFGRRNPNELKALLKGGSKELKKGASL